VRITIQYELSQILRSIRKYTEVDTYGKLNMNESQDVQQFNDALKRGVFANAAKVLLMRDDLVGKVVIDLACGDGRTTYLLRKRGALVSPRTTYFPSLVNC
jgi:hypothetical protein